MARPKLGPESDDVELTSPSSTGGGAESAAVELGAVDESALRRKVSRRVVAPLFVIMFIALIDRANLSYAALSMKADLGLTDLEYGF